MSKITTIDKSSLPVENLRPTNKKIFEQGPLSSAKRLIQTFSTTNSQRHTKIKTKKKHIRLITIGASQFSEKVRWGLDLLEADPNSDVFYSEDAHPPILAMIATLEASGGKASMTPMVEYYSNKDDNESNEKKILYDSQNILPIFCPFLYPIGHQREIRAIEMDLGARLGATTRCFMYHILSQPMYRSVLVDISTRQTSTIEKIIWTNMVMDTGSGNNGILSGMHKAMGINEDAALVSLNTIRNVFDDVSRRLSRSEPPVPPMRRKFNYLMDTESSKIGFTAADLTFSSLAAPLIGPPELSPFILTTSLPPKHNTNAPHQKDDFVTKEVLPRELSDLRTELRKTIAGQHVLEMYRKHRFGAFRTIEENDSFRISNNNAGERKVNLMESNGKSGVVIPKVVNRDKLPSQAVATPAEVIAAFKSLNSRGKKKRTKFESKL